MPKRNIIKIDEDRCDGCGLCIPNCPEGALQVIDGKVRLVSDIACDGLGACIGHCPKGAISIEEREAEPYDERKVMENIIKKGKNVIKAHLQHLKAHNQEKYLDEAIKFLEENDMANPLEDGQMEPEKKCSCPGAAVRTIDNESDAGSNAEQKSALKQWPVQLGLLPPNAPFFENSHLLVSADCVPFANADFHSKLLNGKSLVIGCPKLDDISAYQKKLTEIFRENRIKSITAAIMEVPCCHGLYAAVEQAIKDSGKSIPLIKEVVGLSGKIE